jgi:hypothetical protein
MVNAFTTPHLLNLFPVHFARIAKVFRPVGLKGREGELEGLRPYTFASQSTFGLKPCLKRLSSLK